MSTIKLVEIASTPATPSAGQVRLFVNASGSLCSVDDGGVVKVYAEGITQEQVEDIVGALLQDSSTVNVTYNDAGNAVTLDVIEGGVDHNALLNYVANQHIDHSTVSISAGSGLTGGGDITASRTISMPNVGTPGTYRSVTTDAQGRVTAGANPTTLAGYGITDAQPLDSDLTAIAGLAGTGLVTRTGTGAATTRTLTAGTGITVSNGDGVSGNPTVAIANTGVTANTYGSATIVPSITVNAQGQITGVTNNLIAIPPTQVTGFDEAAQDAVGGILTDSSSIDFTYSDGGNSIQAAVIPGGVDHNGLLNLTTGNPHTQYLQTSVAATTYQPLDPDLSAIAALGANGILVRTAPGGAAIRTIAGGTGITVTNGDAVAGSPTVAISNTGVTAATYGSATQVPQIAINAQGQATSASNVSIQIAQSQVTNLTTDLAGKANLAGGNTFTGSQTINGNTVTVFDTTGTSVNINSNGGLGNTSNVNFTPFVGRTGGPSSIVRAIDNGASSSDLIFLNAPAGSSSVATELFRITSDGRFTFTSTTGPLSIPRMTTAQREAITSPLVGSQVYDTTIGTICWWNGSAWLFEIDLVCVNNQTSTSVTYANITELTSPVLPAARYQFEFTGVGQSTVTTTGIGIRLGAGTATVSSVVANWGFSQAANGTDKNFEYSQLGPTTDIASTGVLTANTDFPMYGTGVFTTSTAGTVAAQIRSEIAASGVSIRINSHLRIRKITG